MIRLIALVAVVSSTAIAQAQSTPPVQINPFVTSQPAAPAGDSMPVPDGKGVRHRGSSAMPSPIPVASLGQQDATVSQELKATIDGAVLVARTKTHAILGFPVLSNSQTSAQVKNLRNVTVRNGGTFYIGSRRLKMELDDDQPGARVMMDGAVLFTVNFDSQRSISTATTQYEQAASGGSGVGQAATNSGGGGMSTQRVGQQGTGQPGQSQNGQPPLTR